MRGSNLLALVTLVSACFNPEDPGGFETEGNATGEPMGPIATTIPAGVADGSSTSDGGVSTLPTGDSAVCGDGEVTASEVCDDGINDGTYGGCNGDCTLAAFCGDGSVDETELCDEGGNNANGSGCNVDCTVSGAVVGELLQTGLVFCDGAFTTPPQFTTEGMTLVSASGNCPSDTQLLQRLTVSVEVDEEFDELLPDTPVRTATMVGDTWLLASVGCNYTIAPDGTYSEVCESGRVTGRSQLDGIDGDNYVAFDSSTVAWFGAGSPAVGDLPVWTQSPPSFGLDVFAWRSMVEADNQSVLVGGSRTAAVGGASVASLTQFTAAGNLVDTTTYASIREVNAMAVSPDGSVLLLWRALLPTDPIYPDGMLLKLNAAFDEEWSAQLVNPGLMRMAFDSAGDVVVLHQDGNGAGSFVLRKLAAADGAQRWSTALPEVTDYPELAVADDDYIWVAAPTDGKAGGQLWVGRVAP